MKISKRTWYWIIGIIAGILVYRWWIKKQTLYPVVTTPGNPGMDHFMNDPDQWSNWQDPVKDPKEKGQAYMVNQLPGSMINVEPGFFTKYGNLTL